VLAWDHVLDRSSVEAGIYVAWESALRRAVNARLLPPRSGLSMALRKVIEVLHVPPGELGTDPLQARDELLLSALTDAVEELTTKLGSDMEGWRWGQPAYHHAYLRHPLGNAVDGTTRARLEVGPAPRGGYGSTVNQTTNGDNQTSGASFRIIVDTGDWDRSLGMNAPGQSGDPDAPHYRDLFREWANDRFHPVVYTRARVEAALDQRIRLRPVAQEDHR
jgi:penicillin amidase